MTRKNQLGSVLVLLVFAVFVTSVLLVLLTGADIVQKLNERDQASYDRRTIAQYLTTRVRQGDCRDRIEVRENEGRSVLVMTQTLGGVDYETLVYSYGGYVCELFAEAGLNMDLEFGEQILPAEELSFSDGGDYLTATIVMKDGEERDLLLALRSERGSER